MVFVWHDRDFFVAGMVVGVGPVAFHLYGLLIGLGIIVGAYVGAKLVKVKMDSVWDGLVWVVAGGLIGARAYHVLDLWQYYWLNPGEIVMLWKGGMGIFGGMLGGVVGLWIWSGKGGYELTRKVRNLKFFKLMDVAGFGLPVGQFIGRWGNYFNQELYGKPFDSAQGKPFDSIIGNPPFWSIYIAPENRLTEVMDYERFHPLFLYEGIWNLIGFVGLWWFLKKKRLKTGEGGVLVSYLGWYGLGRFLLEFLKIEVWQVCGVNTAQVISLGLVGLAVWWWRRA